MESANSTTAPDVEFFGVAFQFGHRTLIIPPLSTGQVRTNYPQIMTLGNDTPDDKLNDVDYMLDRMACKLQIILLATKRNYPGMTLGELEDIVECGTIETLLMAALGSSMSPKTRTAPAGEFRPVV